MLVLALEAASGQVSAGLARDGDVLAERRLPPLQGQAGALAPLVEAILTECGVAVSHLTAIGVSVGPGSFTGLRAALSLAHGLSAAADAKLIGVSVGDALSAGAEFAGRAFWAVTDNRRGRILLERDGELTVVAPADLPIPDEPVAVGGDMAVEVAARLAARGADVLLTERRRPTARDVAQAAILCLRTGRPGRPALPLYVEAPEARLPAGGLRPAPAP